MNFIYIHQYRRFSSKGFTASILSLLDSYKEKPLNREKMEKPQEEQ